MVMDADRLTYQPLAQVFNIFVSYYFITTFFAGSLKFIIIVKESNDDGMAMKRMSRKKSENKKGAGRDIYRTN